MAFTSSDEAPKLLKVSGETTEMVCGIDTASGSALTVTCPQLVSVKGVVATAYTSGAAVSVTATATNTFTVATTNATDVFAWIAWGVAKI
jgi:hypothetical protein